MLMRIGSFFVSCVALLGCALVHERSSTGASTTGDASVTVDGSAADPAYDAALAHPAPPSAAPGCGEARFHDFAPAGMTDVRFPALAGIGSGFVATFVHFAEVSYSPFGTAYPTAAARMRGDLSDVLDAPRDAGIVTEQGGIALRTSLAVGGDGRLATCAAPYTNSDYAVVPGGVAIFDADGTLVHLARLPAGCADVAYVDDRWVALETRVDERSERHLVVLDPTTLEPARRIAFDATSDGIAYERIVARGERAVLLLTTFDGPRLLDVDLDAGVVVRQRDVPLDLAFRVIEPEVDVVAREGRLSVVYRASDGRITWAVLDEAFDVAWGPIVMDEAVEYPILDVTILGDGLVAAWSRGPYVEPPLAVALIDDVNGTVTTVEPELPSAFALATTTVQVSVSNDVVAVAMHVDDPGLATSSVGIWSSRCRAR